MFDWNEKDMAGTMMPTWLRRRMTEILFYEWSYGRLAAGDAKIGPLGEYLVGIYAGVLDAHRPETATFDLRSVYGQSLEVKTTGRKFRPSSRQQPVFSWALADQTRALKGERPLADAWIFLVAEFPSGVDKNRFFDAMDPRWWRCYLLEGARLRTSGLRRRMIEPTLTGEFGLKPFGPGDLNEALRTLAGAAEPRKPEPRPGAAFTGTAGFLARKLGFFRWAYGDLTAAMNLGKLAEFQVMRLGCRPTAARFENDAMDLRTRAGTPLEVKFSWTRTNRTERPGHNTFLFVIPPYQSFDHRTGTREAMRRRSSKVHVFCVIDVTAAERARPDFSVLDLKNWGFYIVPTAELDALGNKRKVSSSRLEKLGHPRMGAGATRKAIGEM